MHGEQCLNVFSAFFFFLAIVWTKKKLISLPTSPMNIWDNFLKGLILSFIEKRQSSISK